MSEKRVQQNVGSLDSWFRVAGGLVLLTFGATGRLGRSGSLLGIAIGACSVADGLTRYCPYYDMLGLSTLEGDEKRGPINPDQLNRSSVQQIADQHDAVPREFPWESQSAQGEQPQAPMPDEKRQTSYAPKPATTRRL